MHGKHIEITIDKPMRARTVEELHAELLALMADCPECQAARARGEEPVIGHGRDLLRARDRFRRPRWRELRKRITWR